MQIAALGMVNYQNRFTIRPITAQRGSDKGSRCACRCAERMMINMSPQGVRIQVHKVTHAGALPVF